MNFKSINWGTVIVSVALSIITAHIMISKLIDKIAEGDKKFLEQIKNITVKTVEEKIGNRKL